MKADFGLIGLGVMGENLALNIEEKGFTVAVFNRSLDKVDAFTAANKGKRILGTRSIKEFADCIDRPRRAIIMVKAGSPVDQTIDELGKYFAAGDVIIDGGNEFFTNTERRSTALAKLGIGFVGMGVSGGEEGARHGPSLMPGGSAEAYAKIEAVVTKIAAQVKDGPCVAHIGPGGSGHFVKMVHNGIEYGDMQLIAEVYDLLKNVGGLSNLELAEVFAEWNQAELESFLIEITSRIFRNRDPETGRDVVDVIVDAASMKGTGKWTVQQAAELSAPIPTIAAAVEARVVSAMRDMRLEAAKVLKGPSPLLSPLPSRPAAEKKDLIAETRAALYAAKVCSYAQGMAMLRKASDTYGWSLNLGEIARIWKGGCIIRAELLGRIQEAFVQGGPAQDNLLLSPSFREDLGSRQEAWRKLVSRATLAGIGVPALSASLAYYDGIRRERMPANLVQAQRDFFGAHTYQRLDREGTFHTKWT